MEIKDRLQERGYYRMLFIFLESYIIKIYA
jgi:hypothetical protein